MRIDISQLDFIDDILKSMVMDVERHFRFKLTITSLYRPNDPGVHGTLPVRGMDISCPDESAGIAIVKYINSKYQYDPKRVHKVVCMWHGEPKHLHFQSHPNTEAIA